MNVAKSIVLAAGAALVIAAWGCDKNDGEEQASAEKKERPVYKVPAELDRELGYMELDSLFSMKASQKITRDEYWDDYGGVLANDAVEVWYPDGKVNILQGAAMLKHAMAARQRLNQLLGRVPEKRAVIVCSGNVEVYVWATGREWWTYSTIKGDTISVQAPIDLHTRGLLPVVGPREYFEWAIIQLTNGSAPRWLQEGLASYLSGEGVILEDQRQDFVALGSEINQPSETERALREEKERREARRGYYNAYRMTEQIAKQHGEAALGRWVNALATSTDLDATSREAFGVGYDELLEESMAWATTEASP